MNILIAALLCFALLGALDKLFNGVMGVAPAFDQGLASMGPLCLSMAGIIFVDIFLHERYNFARR